MTVHISHLSSKLNLTRDESTYEETEFSGFSSQSAWDLVSRVILAQESWIDGDCDFSFADITSVNVKSVIIEDVFKELDDSLTHMYLNIIRTRKVLRLIYTQYSGSNIHDNREVVGSDLHADINGVECDLHTKREDVGFNLHDNTEDLRPDMYEDREILGSDLHEKREGIGSDLHRRE
ncbi:hypothetical protein DPMN_064656 [Dreissena polymorpha]|uniref:Uncharacterized protein n=1 Tax=Dreissena polymorpha TaxID=45954 RepID=A0A9D4CDZ0_DREPO|nr:hypothetical protein DPMN_064656 [Dreissena polymorpha]